MQTPKSILLHLDSSPHTARRIRVAAQVAQAFGAQVSAMPCTLTALMRYPFALEGAADAIAIMQELDKDARHRMRAEFFASGGNSPHLHWVEPVSDAPWGFWRQALYADLLILGQRDEDDETVRDLPPDFLASLVLESGRPALVLPYAGSVDKIGNTVLLAWKETREAAHAVSAALPWLRQAGSVHAVSFGEGADTSLASLHAYLDRQGVAATLVPGGADERDAGARLLSHAADVGADLLVMGCYGHGRLREWVLGGATRTVLDSMTLPVLLAH